MSKLLAALTVVCLADVRCPMHSVPVLRPFDPETAHRLAIFLASIGMVPRQFTKDDPILQTTIKWRGRIVTLPNPVIAAAGFDKDGVAVNGLLGMGFAGVEVGSVTPQPQPGNAQPRVFRGVDFIVNRYGFNSQGHERVYCNVSTAKTRGRLLGINLGKNKDSVGHDDFVSGVHMFSHVADYLAINISSPNTPGLRAMAQRETLDALLGDVVRARDHCGNTPLCLKISPDMTHEELADVVELAKKHKIDGLIISNTHLVNSPEVGGLSGRPIFNLALETVKRARTLLKDSEIVLIGCGGISTAEDALAMARAGATLVQMYTALALSGPHVLYKIKRGIAAHLRDTQTTWNMHSV